MEAIVDNAEVENVFDGNCPKSLAVTIPSHQFPLFSNNTDNANQLASKAKDSLEDRKKKGSGGVLIIGRRSQAPCEGAIRGNLMSFFLVS